MITLICACVRHVQAAWVEVKVCRDLNAQICACFLTPLQQWIMVVYGLCVTVCALCTGRHMHPARQGLTVLCDVMRCCVLRCCSCRCRSYKQQQQQQPERPLAIPGPTHPAAAVPPCNIRTRGRRLCIAPQQQPRSRGFRSSSSRWDTGWSFTLRPDNPISWRHFYSAARADGALWARRGRAGISGCPRQRCRPPGGDRQGYSAGKQQGFRGCGIWGESSGGISGIFWV